MAEVMMSCAVENSFMRAEMNACATSELVECAHAETEAAARAELSSVNSDRTSKSSADRDRPSDGSRPATRRPMGKEAGPADTPACASDICVDRESPREHHVMTGREPASTPISNTCTAPREACVSREHNVVCTKGGMCKGRVHVKEMKQ